MSDSEWVSAAALGPVAAAAGEGGRAMARLTELCDTFGHRMCGSEALERSIDWLLARLRAEGFENVRGEPVRVPHWVRGAARLEAAAPRALEMPVLALGGSPGTDGTLEAEVTVVRSYEELDRAAAEGRVRGRVVLFNPEWTSYGDAVPYRLEGPARAAALGAAAVLVRSVCPQSLGVPHAGVVYFGDGDARVPAAAVTTEDAARMQRWQDAGGEATRVRLELGCRALPDADSRNVVAEIRGRELPDEVVVFGGHIDSWDQGDGAHDDAQGVVVAWEVLSVLRDLGLRPRRTVRMVAWTDEEQRSSGADAYRDAHRAELAGHVAAIETDLGVGPPVGFGFSGTDEQRARAARALAPLGALGERLRETGRGVDISPLIDEGVPGLLLWHSEDWRGRDYFQHHHAASDTVASVDPALLRENAKAVAAAVYALAEAPGRI